MDRIIRNIEDLFIGWGASESISTTLTTLSVTVTFILLMCLLYYLLSRHIEPLLNKLTAKTSIKWDDIIFRPKAMKWVWILIPVIICHFTIPAILAAYPTLESVSFTVIEIVIILVLMMLVIESLKSVFLLITDHDRIDEIATQMRMAQENGEEYEYQPSHSLKGLQQMLVIVVVGMALILCVSVLFGKNPLIIISGLGAAAAILMLVFQDSILGVVAGIQLTANDMLQPGDWISVPKFEANGIVREVTLAAVKVQNWDKTIVTIPPYKLLTEGFQNWRGMQQAKGRRIARDIRIDMTTISFATEEQINRWSQEPWWKEPEEGKRPVTLTIFRKYLEYYVTTISSLRRNMLYMIRELDPTPDGLPLQIYMFTSKTDWKKYEVLQADIIDHVLAVLPEFGLRVFQHPTGADIRSLTEK